MSGSDKDTRVKDARQEKSSNQRSLIESAVAVFGNKYSFLQNEENQRRTSKTPKT